MCRLGMSPRTAEEKAAGSANMSSTKTTGVLFKEFFAFYTSFDWRKEAVSVRHGRRTPPNLQLPIHIIVCDDGSTEVGPSIEDPFKPSQNLGSSVTPSGFAHMREELARAHSLCSSGASLTSLLEPWSPAEVDAGEQSLEVQKADGSD